MQHINNQSTRKLAWLPYTGYNFIVNAYGGWQIGLWTGHTRIGNYSNSTVFSTIWRHEKSQTITWAVIAEDLEGSNEVMAYSQRFVVRFKKLLISFISDKSQSIDEYITEAVFDALEKTTDTGSRLAVIISAVYHKSDSRQRKTVLRPFYVGSCRAYLLRNHRTFSVIWPHTRAIELYRLGTLNLSEIARHPSHKIPTRWLGQTDYVFADTQVVLPNQQLDVSTPHDEEIELLDGDIIFLCTSAVQLAVESGARLYNIIGNHRPQKAVDQLFRYIRNHRFEQLGEVQAITLTLPTTLQWIKFTFLRLFEIGIRTSLLLLLFAIFSYSFVSISFSDQVSDDSSTSSTVEASLPIFVTPSQYNELLQPLSSRSQYSTPIPSTPTSAPLLLAAPVALITSVATPTPPLSYTNGSFGSITLIDPPDYFVSNALIAFRWQYDGVLNDGEKYEVFFWKEGQDPTDKGRGMAALTDTNFLTVNLCILDKQLGDAFEPMQEYLWGVRIRSTESDSNILYTSDMALRFSYTRACGGTVPQR